MKIRDYLNEGIQLNEDINNLLELAVFMDDGQLDEGILKKTKNVLPKLGIDIEKKGQGIIGKLKDPKTKEFFKLLFKAFKGDEEAKTKVKEMSKEIVSKGDIVNILLKLDSITLHMISGPVHILEYLTGWKISGVKKEMKSVVQRIDKAMASLKDLYELLKGKQKKVIGNSIANLKRLNV